MKTKKPQINHSRITLWMLLAAVCCLVLAANMGKSIALACSTPPSAPSGLALGTPVNPGGSAYSDDAYGGGYFGTGNSSTPSTNPTASSVYITWNASNPGQDCVLTGYAVVRSGKQIATVTTNNYYNSGLASGATYHYSVFARNDSSLVSSDSNTLQVKTAGLLGDINNDNRINAIELSTVLTRDNQDYTPADFNVDNVIGAADLSIVLSRWTW